MSRLASDEEGIVLNWLIKVSIALVVVGLILFEVTSLVLVRATARDTASKAAVEAGFRYRDTRSEERAAETARQYVENEGAEFLSLVVDDERDEIRVTVKKTARTLFVRSIGFLEEYATVEVSEAAPIT